MTRLLQPSGLSLTTGEAVDGGALAALRTAIGWETASVPGQLLAQARGERTIFLAYVDEQPVGTITVEWMAATDQHDAPATRPPSQEPVAYGFLNDLAVHPAYRRRGLGHWLVWIAEQAIRAAERRWATIQTNIAAVQRLYERWGYRPQPHAPQAGFVLLAKELR